MITQAYATEVVEKMDMEYTTAVVLTGLTLVFVALVILIVFVYLFGAILKKSRNGSKTSKPKGNSAVMDEKNASMQIESGISDEVIAVIAAAIAAATDSSEGVVFSKIRSIKQSKPQRSVWASAGAYENTKSF